MPCIWVGAEQFQIMRKEKRMKAANRRMIMTQELLEMLEQAQLMVEVQERVQCDQCSARAKVLVDLPYGQLSFCHHHYNIHAQALTEQGAIAKLLDITAEKQG